MKARQMAHIGVKEFFEHPFILCFSPFFFRDKVLMLKIIINKQGLSAVKMHNLS